MFSKQLTKAINKVIDDSSVELDEEEVERVRSTALRVGLGKTSEMVSSNLLLPDTAWMHVTIFKLSRDFYVFNFFETPNDSTESAIAEQVILHCRDSEGGRLPPYTRILDSKRTMFDRSEWSLVGIHSLKSYLRNYLTDLHEDKVSNPMPEIVGAIEEALYMRFRYVDDFDLTIHDISFSEMAHSIPLETYECDYLDKKNKSAVFDFAITPPKGIIDMLVSNTNSAIDYFNECCHMQIFDHLRGDQKLIRILDEASKAADGVMNNGSRRLTRLSNEVPVTLSEASSWAAAKAREMLSAMRISKSANSMPGWGSW